MEKPKILIADSLEDFRDALAEALKPVAHIKTADNGPRVLELLAAFQPDTLALDMMLPGLDGISLLQRIAQKENRPMVLATTRCSSGYVMDACDRFGVDYIMSRPCEIRATVDRILDLCDRRRTQRPPSLEPSVLLSRMLLRMGLANRHHGCPYLHEAILLMSRNRGQAITKELYPAVGAIFGINALQVERCIRNALHLAWAQRDNEIWKEYLDSDPDGTVPRPSNGDFICRMADLLLLRLGEGTGE